MKSKIYAFALVLGLLILSACGPIDFSAIENQITAGEVPQEVVQNVISMLSEQLGEPESEIEVIELEQVDWPDTCLGLSLQGQECEQIVTPGYRIVLKVNGVHYEFRSDNDGILILQVSSPEETETPMTETPTLEPSVMPTLTPEDQTSVAADCYMVSFLGMDENGDGTTMWRYEVEEEPCAQDLGNWVLELPTCAQIVDADPSPWEAVNPDPNIQLNGIKWQTGAGFEEGEFMVMLSDNLAVGETSFGVKGPDVAMGSIAGPVCSEEIGMSEPTEMSEPTATSESMATDTPEEETPSGEMIMISDNDQTLEMACEGAEVIVKGNGNTLTLSGTCYGLTIQGNDNWISLETSPMMGIMDYGNGNTIVEE